jgi:hypothetical protein
LARVNLRCVCARLHRVFHARTLPIHDDIASTMVTTRDAATRAHQGAHKDESQNTQNNGRTSARLVEQGKLLSASANFDTLIWVTATDFGTAQARDSLVPLSNSSALTPTLTYSAS